MSAREWSVAWKTLVARPSRNERGRTALAIVAVALAIAVVVAIRMANRTALESFEQTSRAVAGRGALTVHGPTPISSTLFPRLRWLGAYAEAEPYIDRYAYDPRAHDTLELLGLDWAAEVAHHLPLNRNLIAPGSRQQRRAAVLLTSYYAQRYHYRRGDWLPLVLNGRLVRLWIAGVLPQSKLATAQSGHIALMDVAAEAHLLGQVRGAPLRFDGLQLRLAPGVSEPWLASQVQPFLPADDHVEPAAVRRRQTEKMVSAFAANLRALSYVALLVGAFLIYNTIAMGVVRRRTAIATLRALGASRRAILAVFLAEALLLSVIGGLAGLALGRLLAGLALHLVSMTLNALYTVTHPKAVRFTAGDLVWALILAVGVGLISAWGPAREAARVAPAEGMRPGLYETQFAVAKHRWLWLGLACALLAAVCAKLPAIGTVPFWGFASALMAVLGMGLLLPFAVSHLLRLGRSRLLDPASAAAGRNRWWPLRLSLGLAAASLLSALRRTSVLLAALTTAVAMFIAVAIMVGSFRVTVSTWLGETLRADVFLRARDWTRSNNAPLPREVLRQLERLPGVGAAGEYSAVPETYRGQRIFISTAWSRDLESGRRNVRLAGEASGPMHRGCPLRFLRSAGDWNIWRRGSRRGEVFVSEPFARHFDRWPGRQIQLPTQAGPQKLRIAAVFRDYSSSQGYVFMNLALFEKLYGKPLASSAGLYARPGMTVERLLAQVTQVLASMPGERQALTVNDYQSLWREALKVFDQTFRVTWSLELIALAVAILGVANTLLAVALERRRELAVLLFLGATRRQTRRMLLGEAVWIGALALLFGTLLGVVLAAILIFVINVQSFGWTIQVHAPWTWLLPACLLVFAATLIAALGPAGVAAQVDPVAAVRVE